MYLINPWIWAIYYKSLTWMFRPFLGDSVIFHHHLGWLLGGLDGWLHMSESLLPRHCSGNLTILGLQNAPPKPMKTYSNLEDNHEIWRCLVKICHPRENVSLSLWPQTESFFLSFPPAKIHKFNHPTVGSPKQTCRSWKTIHENDNIVQQHPLDATAGFWILQ